MNKKIITAALTFCMSAAISIPAFAADSVKILINGSELDCSAYAEPYIENGRTLVPMRAIYEALGASVVWDEETRTVVSYDPVSDVSITLQIDADTMFVNETAVTLDVPATIKSDNTFVPLRAVAEGMNSVVGWDEAGIVTIDKALE